MSSNQISSVLILLISLISPSCTRSTATIDDLMQESMHLEQAIREERSQGRSGKDLQAAVERYQVVAAAINKYPEPEIYEAMKRVRGTAKPAAQ